ncbi:MAG TPA: DEAD/DEAH box helicase, partial [Beijerinckiaceae bacterium]|nr:DEAD/DEAH box helicase [Beijerinckiaceae bacterium]
MAERSSAETLTGHAGELATRLLAWTREAPLVHVAGSERRANELAALVRGLAPDLAVDVLPGWDCLPYDRAPPSRLAMGRRTAALARMAQAAPALLLTTPDAILQRVPPRSLWPEIRLELHPGEPVADLAPWLSRAGYVLDERVDEPGEAALRGEVIDLFPAGAAVPVRIDHADGRVTALWDYDPVSQLTIAEREAVVLDPASECVTGSERFPGMEHWLPDFVPGLETLFDYLPEAGLAIEPKAEERRLAFLEQVADAHAGRRARPEREGRPPLPPERLYLDAAAWDGAVRGRRLSLLAFANGEPAVPRFAAGKSPIKAAASFVAERLRKGRVVLAGSER